MSAATRESPFRLESHRFRLLLLTLVALAAVQAFGLADLLGGAVHAVVGSALIAATLWVLHPRRPLFWTALVLALPTIVEVLRSPAGPDVAELAGSRLQAPFFCLAAAALSAQVVSSERADEDTVVGSICAYLFIALAFASLYTAIAASSPESFQLGDLSPGERLFDRLAYLSLVTITTLGYGDIVPVSGLARSLVSLEAITGILFPSIVIARIVSLYTSGGGRPFAVRAAPQRPGRFELLLATEVVLLLATPGPEGSLAARIALGMLAALLLLAALHAGSDRTLTRAVGASLALLSLAARWWPGAQPGWREAALGFETVLLALVASSLFGWLLREQRVTRELLLAAVALYGLLGFAWASAFGLLEIHSPGAHTTGDGGASRSDLVYYSFMTLTTTGFGDIAPISPVAKRLATFESLIGILYPSMLVARLVALYRSD